MLVLASALAPQSVRPVPVRIIEHAPTPGIPAPQQMRTISQGQPFTVPPGMVFVVTALGAASTGSGVSLQINGAAEVVAYPANNSAAGVTMQPLPSGFVAPSGSVLEPVTGGGNGRAWGYLADV